MKISVRKRSVSASDPVRETASSTPPTPPRPTRPRARERSHCHHLTVQCSGEKINVWACWLCRVRWDWGGAGGPAGNDWWSDYNGDLIISVWISEKQSCNLLQKIAGIISACRLYTLWRWTLGHGLLSKERKKQKMIVFQLVLNIFASNSGLDISEQCLKRKQNWGFLQTLSTTITTNEMCHAKS